MKETVIIRYGEISLKSEPVRKKFERILIGNLKESLEGLKNRVRQKRGRIFIDTPTPFEVAKRASNIPGVVSTSPAKMTDSEMGEIRSLAKSFVQENFSEKGSFAVDARRSGNHPFSSVDLEEKVGRDVLELKPNLEVDLENPDQKIYLEVRENDSYVFNDFFDGIGGLPVGSQGNTIIPFLGNKFKFFISCFLLLKRGSPIFPIYIDDELFEWGNFCETVKNLKSYHPNIAIFKLNNNISEKITNNDLSEPSQKIMFEKIALEIGEIIAGEMNGEAIVSDKNLEDMEKIGLENIEFVEKNLDSPVLYPRSGVSEEKQIEIIERAEMEPNPKDLDPKVPEGKEISKVKIDKVLEDIIDSIDSEKILKNLEKHTLEDL